MEGPPPQALSAQDMVALATALLPSLLLQQTHIPRGYGQVGYPIPDGEETMEIEEKGMEWVAGWVRAARPDLTDACTHGLALPLLSLASRTWFQDNHREPGLEVDKAVGDAIVVSEEAVAAFYATLHSNCVVRVLEIQGAAFGTPAAAAHLGRCLNLNSTLRQLTITVDEEGEAALRIRRDSGSCWGEAAWTALSEALTSNATIEEIEIWYVPGGMSSHVSATFAAASQKLSALRTFLLDVGIRAPPETATLGCMEGWAHVLKQERCTLTKLDLGLLLPAQGGLVAICEALRTNTTLETLTIGSLRIGPHWYDGRASIEAMVNIEEADAEALAAMLRTNTTLTTLKMRSSGILWNAMVVEQGLSCNSSLEELEVSLDPDGAHALMTLLQRPGGPISTSTATPASNASTTCPSQLRKLKLETSKGRGFPTASALTTFFLGPGAGLEALSDNTSITRLRLVPHEFPSESLSPDALLARLLPILQNSKTLQELDLTIVRPDWGWPAEFGRGLIRSLKHNPSVTVLILDGWHFLDDGLLQDLLESLRDNTNLKRISIENTPWKSQGKETTIRQALRQVAYLSVLKHADIKFTPPKSGRLFLCGPGFAGKTTLRGSLIRSWKSRKWIARLRAGVRNMASPRRTEGIEIEVLRKDDTMRVTIWDLAGQDTFRILQQHLFPTVSQACIFFLVFSPFDQETGQVKREWQEDLQVQLRDWLRFITSNTSTKLHGSIQVCVILTHLDKMSDFTSVTMVDFATSSIQTVTRVFDGVLEGGPESVPVFALNCKSERDVAPLLDDVFLRFEQLLGNRLLLVPEPCTKMSIALAKWISNHPNQPIMRLERFHALCRRKVVALQGPAGQDELANPVQDAISSYLHDVGVIMFFKGLKFLVVNPNWVTHILLGQLITFGCSKMPSTKHGVVTESQLEHVLKQFVKQGRYEGFNEKDLILLMLKLELCYKEEPDTSRVTRYFVPTTLDDANGNALTGRRPVDWPVYQAAKDCIHIGRRLQCEDEIKTVLGPGFFPKLQVRLRNRLFEKKEQIRMAAEKYQIQRNLITFHTEGIQVILESPGDIADYVDILVKSFGKTQEQTMAFLMEHVMEEVQSLRESIIPGVVLLEGIIRKACVSKLTLCAHRRNQAVLKQELLSRLEALVDSYQNPLDYPYTWTKVSETNDLELDCAYEKATDLLDPGELRAALNKKRRSLEQEVTKIDEAARLVVGETHSNEQPVPRVSPHNQKDPALKPTLSTLVRSVGADVITLVRSVGADVKNHMSSEIEKLHNEIHGIQSLLEEVLGIQERTMDSLLAKMDEIMNFSAQLLSTPIPRRPYFTTSDTGKVHRLVAATRIGKAVMLHFMCEAGRGHIVEGQAGYKLTVEDADWKWIRPIAVNAMRLLVFLVKAGVHVAAGIGDAVPDYANWGGAIPLTAVALSGETLSGQIHAEGNTCSEQDWDALKEKMKPLLEGKMVELFGLNKVRFTRGPQQGVGWVCSNCLRSGKANDILEAL